MGPPVQVSRLSSGFEGQLFLEYLIFRFKLGHIQILYVAYFLAHHNVQHNTSNSFQCRQYKMDCLNAKVYTYVYSRFYNQEIYIHLFRD